MSRIGFPRWSRSTNSESAAVRGGRREGGKENGVNVGIVDGAGGGGVFVGVVLKRTWGVRGSGVRADDGAVNVSVRGPGGAAADDD